MKEQYGDHLLAECGLTVIKGDQQGTDVPEGFDPTTLKTAGVLRNGETYIVGTEAQRRAVEELNAPYGRKLLWHLLNNQSLIPDSWKQMCIAFAGDFDLCCLDELDKEETDGERCVLYLIWVIDQWCWDCCWLDESGWTNSARVLVIADLC